MRSAWQVRAGRRGERDQESLENGLIILGWEEVPDLAQFQTKNDLKSGLQNQYPQRSAYVLGNWTGQLWRFYHEISEGDLVVMPLKSQRRYAIGEVSGDYHYRTEAKPGYQHVRPVRWIRTDVEPQEFEADLRGSMGALLTVCQLSRHEAPHRIGELAEGRPDPGWQHKSTSVDPDATRSELWEAVEAGVSPVRLTVRDLLAKWDFNRRTATSLATIQADLAERGISTKPSFTAARMDSLVELIPAAAEPDASDEVESPESAESAELDDLPVKWLVSGLLPTEGSVESVRVDSPLSVATTLMLGKDYSQLAVVDDEGHYAGAVSWESIGRAQLSKADATLRDATMQVRVVDHDDDLFNQIDEIYQRGFVLVRGEDRRTLIGIVTTNDLARQFGTLARPFSLVEEAELRLRRHTKRSLPEEVIARHAPRWASGTPTFGTYGQIFKELETFQQLGWPLDHATFLDLLRKVKNIRNELMHFSQDTLPPQEMALIEGFVSMLRTVDRSM